MIKLKVNILILTIFLLPASLFSQTIYSFGPIKSTEFGGFYSVPIGDFGSTNTDNGGFALPGYGIYIDSETRYQSGLILSTSTSYQWNDLDGNALSVTLAESLADAGVSEVAISGGTYKPLFIMTGLGYEFILLDGLSFDILPRIGLLYNSFEEFDMTIDFSATDRLDYTDIVTYDSDFAFAYSVFAQVNVSIFRDLTDFIIFGNYSASNLKTSLKSFQFGKLSDGTEKLEFLNVGVGLTFSL